MPISEQEAVVRARERVGNVLKGKYRLDRVLGVGGMAAVYGATHLRNTNRVAVKILHREVAMEPDLRERFLREGYAANSVEHPGTVRIIDDDTAEDGAVFLVMELLEGETLDARWERKGGKLKPDEVTQLLHDLLDVLAAAHAKGIVHRDIKPENLFLTRERNLKVLDFGVARLREGSVSMTRSGGVLGTPAFMAPEQVLGKAREVDAQSDLWSVGATAFTLLSGRFVHEAETPEEMMVFTATRPAPSLTTVAPDLPAALVRAVDRALKMDKRERWPTARAMQAALDGVDDPVPVAGEGAAPAHDADELEDKTTLRPPAPDASALTEDISTTTTARRDASVPRLQEIESPAPGDVPSGPPPSAPSGTKIAPHQSSISGVAANTGRGPALLLPAMRRRRPIPAVALGGVAMIAAGILVAMVWRHRLAPVDPVGSATLPPPEASTVALAPLAPVPQGVASGQKEAPPSVAVEALPAKPRPAPTAVQAAPKPALAPAPAAPAVAPASPPSPKASCVPPFTVDPATGMKKWKVECL